MRRRLWWLLVLLLVAGAGIGVGYLLLRQPLRVSWWTRRQQNGYVLEVRLRDGTYRSLPDTRTSA